MISTIQGFIEDNTELEVTRNQIKLALFVIVSLITLVVVFLWQSSTGPQEDVKSVERQKTDFSQTYMQN